MESCDRVIAEKEKHQHCNKDKNKNSSSRGDSRNKNNKPRKRCNSQAEEVSADRGSRNGKRIREEEAEFKTKEDMMVSDGTIREVAVGKGLAGALTWLKEQGTFNVENLDTKEVCIERRDEFGRIMTPKEAYRMFSHQFHGKRPGKIKQEKRIKHYQRELKSKQQYGHDTMEKIKEAQARLKRAYLVL